MRALLKDRFGGSDVPYRCSPRLERRHRRRARGQRSMYSASLPTLCRWRRARSALTRAAAWRARQLPVNGPAWQAMRLSRNRYWGHPCTARLCRTAGARREEKDGWPGLLVGDLAQPRGGPMLTGHASHQIGLDADIWLKPMPKRKLSRARA